MLDRYIITNTRQLLLIRNWNGATRALFCHEGSGHCFVLVSRRDLRLQTNVPFKRRLPASTPWFRCLRAQRHADPSCERSIPLSRDSWDLSRRMQEVWENGGETKGRGSKNSAPLVGSSYAVRATLTCWGFDITVNVSTNYLLALVNSSMQQYLQFIIRTFSPCALH